MKKFLVLGLFIFVITISFGFTTKVQAVVCDLDMVFTANDPVVANSFVNYELKVKNLGSGTCFSGYLSVYYSDNEKYSIATPIPKSGDHFWLLGNIAPGETKAVLVTTKRTNTSPLYTEACVTANNGTDNCAKPTSGTIVVNPPPAPPEPPIVPPVPPMPTDSIDNLTDIPSLPGKESGVWVWESAKNMSESHMNEIALYAKQSGFNIIYLTIDDLLPTLLLPTGQDKTNKLNAYSAEVAKFLSIAQSHGLAVDAVAGWKDWSEPAHQHKPLAMLDYVANFNDTQNIKFRLIQFDIEPYLLTRYEKNKVSVLTNLVNLTDKIQAQSNNRGLSFSMVIPHFYDAAQNWTPSIIFQGKKDYTFNHMLNILDRQEGNSIIIMSYRNYSIGKNGTIEISQKEITDADISSGSTKVIIAQETGPVDPYYVTFYDTSRAYMFSQASLINNAFQSNNSFGGIAVNYIDPFKTLR